MSRVIDRYRRSSAYRPVTARAATSSELLQDSGNLLRWVAIHHANVGGPYPYSPRQYASTARPQASSLPVGNCALGSRAKIHDSSRTIYNIQGSIQGRGEGLDIYDMSVVGTTAKHLSKPCFTRYGRGIRYLGYLDDGEKITRGEGLDLQRSSGCRAPGVTSLMAALLRMINEYGWTLGPGGGTSRMIASRDSQPRRRRRYAPKAGGARSNNPGAMDTSF